MLIYHPQTRISKYFTMAEVAKSDLASRKFIDNTPTSPVLEAARRLADNVLDPIREHYQIPISPLSWYRSPPLEKLLCHDAFLAWANRQGLWPTEDTWQRYLTLKSHPRGEAVDIQIPGIPNDDLYAWVSDNIPLFDQLIREFPKDDDPMSGWVHVSYSLNNNRNERLTIR